MQQSNRTENHTYISSDMVCQRANLGFLLLTVLFFAKIMYENWHTRQYYDYHFNIG